MIYRRREVIESKRILPTGFREVKYLLSTGKQYMDLGFPATQDTQTIAYFGLENVPSSAFILFGARDSASRDDYVFAGLANTHTIYGRFDDLQPTQITNIRAVNGRVYKFDMSKYGCYINNQKTNDYTGYSNFTTPFNLIVGGRHQTTGLNTVNTPIIIGEITVYENNVLISHCYPCVRSIDNTAGFYDVVRRMFLPNLGIGLFGWVEKNGVRVEASNNILPSGYTQKSYIQSHGQEYFRISNFDFNNGVEVDFTIDDNSGSVFSLFGWYDIIGVNGYYVGTTNGDVYTGSSDRSGVLTLATNTQYYLDINNVDVRLNDVYQFARLKPSGSFVRNISVCMRTNNNNSMGHYTIRRFIIKNESGVYTHNLYPCVRDNDSAVGMYDIVNDVFYGNESGNGAFTSD